MDIDFIGQPPLNAGDVLRPGAILVTQERDCVVTRSWIGPVTCLHVQTAAAGDGTVEGTMTLDESRAYCPPAPTPTTPPRRSLMRRLVDWLTKPTDDYTLGW